MCCQVITLEESDKTSSANNNLKINPIREYLLDKFRYKSPNLSFIPRILALL